MAWHQVDRRRVKDYIIEMEKRQITESFSSLVEALSESRLSNQNG